MRLFDFKVAGLMIQFDFLTREGCHLCEEALSNLLRLQRRHDFSVRVVEITGSPRFERLYGDEIPVLLHEDTPVFRERFDSTSVLKYLGMI